MKVTGYTDQHDEKWLRVSLNDEVGFARRDQLIAGTNLFWTSLANSGVSIFQQALKREIENQAQTTNYEAELFVVDHSGWLGPHYIWPEQPLPATLDGKLTIDERPATKTPELKGGSFSGWQQGIERLARGQVLPTFVLCSSLASLLLPFVPAVDDNPAFELFGGNSLGKSKLLLLAGSVFGRGSTQRANWSTTNNGLEPIMARHADRVLLLDEAGLYISSGQRDRTNDYRQAIMILADGTEKTRFGAAVVKRYRFCLLSTTNLDIAGVVAKLSPEEAAATQVRMMTLAADAGAGLGFFDRLPSGCTSSKAAVDLIVDLSNTHYGWAGPAFVKRVELHLASDVRRDRLLRFIDRAMQRFRCAVVPETGTDHRVADKFALVAAAGSLAARWGILPLPYKDVEAAIVAAYRRRSLPRKPADTARPAADEIQAYVRRYEQSIAHLDQGYPDLTTDDLDRAAGFLKAKGGDRWLLIRSARWQREFGSRSKAFLDDLKAAGRLWARDGLQSQEKVRASTAKDRVYRIKLDP